MAFDWGSVIGGIASLGGAYLSGRSADRAGDQAAAGSQQQIDLARDIYNDQRNLNMPAYNAGNVARDQYMRMLGLSVPAAAAPGGVGQVGGGVGQAASQSWFGDNNRVPTVNAQRYATDAAYKRAWDEVAANHQRNYGKGYTSQSDRSALQAHMQELYGKYAPAAAATPGAPATGAPQSLSAIYDQWRNTPGYQFGLQEGNRSIEASAAARGGLNSGATLKALQKYGRDYADQQGYRPYMNDLSNLFGGAQQAVGNIGNAGQSYGSQAGSAYQNAANARAQSTYNQGQAWQDGINGAGYFANKFGQGQGWWG